MARNNDTIQKTLLVAVLLCLVCAMAVSSAAVLLKPLQEANQALDRKRHILASAGLLEEGMDIDAQFNELVEARIVNLRDGTYTDKFTTDSFQQLRLTRDPENSRRLDRQEDIAGLGRREDYAVVYLVYKDGELDKVVLPVRGQGLWSTLHGFIALESDLQTVAGIGFNDHGETPGLGGEIDNPRWQNIWSGKKLYDDGGDVALRVIKGAVDRDRPESQHQIDGISGATLTSNGVTYLVRFWFGEMGYQPFLENLKAGRA